jgi:clan AA aspartic protease
MLRKSEATNMALTKALAVGRKRRKRGKLWPMPIRESDLGHIYTDATIRALAGANKKWTGKFLVDTGATDTFVPASALRRAGIKPAGRRAYELADGTWQELDIGFGVIEVMGLAAGGTVVFAGEAEEPLLGVTVLESTGFMLDPQKERLIVRTPKRKRWG